MMCGRYVFNTHTLVLSLLTFGFRMKYLALYFIILIFAFIEIYNKLFSFCIPLQTLLVFLLICNLPYMLAVFSLQPLILLIIIELVWIVLILTEPSRPLRKIKVCIILSLSNDIISDQTRASASFKNFIFYIMQLHSNV